MAESRKTRVIIMGAAGRDFHNFNVHWKQRPDVEVVAFTATQIPDIAGRVYPAALTGPQYPQGIPIHAEERARGADPPARGRPGDLRLLGRLARVRHAPGLPRERRRRGVRPAGRPGQTMVESAKPVIAVGAVRTGCGKSQTSRRVSEILKGLGRKVAVVRHPMPYGDLAAQAVQRFSSVADMDAAQCTIEEREEYEPHTARGSVVFAGVDYEAILRRAEQEADVVLWDGGNNDTPFYRPDLNIVVADPHRPGHELRYYPGELNVRMADVVIVNKVDTADPEAVQTVEANVRALNPKAVDRARRLAGDRGPARPASRASACW